MESKKYSKLFWYSFILFAIFFLRTPEVFGKYVINQTQLVAHIAIDQTSPSVEVSYSITEKTKESVIVTIQANETLQQLEAWNLDETRTKLTKGYEQNTMEEIQVKDLAGNITKAIIKIENIDKEEPEIKILNIQNSNPIHSLYANQTHTITVSLQMIDNEMIVNKLTQDKIKVEINGNIIDSMQMTLKNQKQTEKEEVILLTLTGIQEEGEVRIEIAEGAAQDAVENHSELITLNTGIMIDNTSPKATYSQKKIAEGKVEATILANEPIKQLEGWELEEQSLKKIFTSSVSYESSIQDLAGNTEKVEINVTGATNIILSYGSHNSEVGWTFGHGNYDIAGMEAVKRNPKYRMESLAFHISGNVEPDFLQAKAYVHSYWGEGSMASCDETGNRYVGGWNPLSQAWKTLQKGDTITMNGKNYVQFGGSGINAAQNTDEKGENPIPSYITKDFPFGITAVQLKLKNYLDYSILYQIYIEGVGWIKVAKNEEVACYQKDKPISAIRIALIPNSEVEALKKTWNEDVGKSI